MDADVLVSIILPVHNAEKWLDECLNSVLKQQFCGRLEISAFNDASTDNSGVILDSWKKKFNKKNINIVINDAIDKTAKGVGYARNRAIQQSNGDYLCFLDADDVMHVNRIHKQYEIAAKNHDAIVGCQFHRDPENSTVRYSKWTNNLTPQELYMQIYTSHGPTLIMPTWFFHIDVYRRVGRFDEGGKGVPEDLIFFYNHLENGGRLYRVNDDLLMYRYHPTGASMFVHEEAIWNLRLSRLEDKILKKWTSFTIWNAGKQGRRFYRSLCQESRNKVVAFCDVDEKKINNGAYTFHESKETIKPIVPIIHFRNSKPPFVLCVKLDLTDGNFETNLESMMLTEDEDYIHFG